MTFASGTIFLFVVEIVFAAVAYYCITQTVKGNFTPHLRRIAGLDAIEEAVGRATEMGRPVHFCPGIGAITDTSAPATFAGLSVLQFVTELTAKYNTELIVTIRQPMVFPIAQETVRQAYLAAGKPDMFQEDTVRYLSSEQFAYAAGVMGIFHREQVAANIMMGAFWAESMLFAEAGAQVGAIQVAGTASPAQIPFFVAACDYTLIGEELFAGGAYLSQDRLRVGSIAGQDYIKLGVMVFLALGTILATAGVDALKQLTLK
ncbi:MAG: DUF6754 domain-containing protein [Bacillota bacterium]|jgi:hypothetical protein